MCGCQNSINTYHTHQVYPLDLFSLRMMSLFIAESWNWICLLHGSLHMTHYQVGLEFYVSYQCWWWWGVGERNPVLRIPLRSQWNLTKETILFTSGMLSRGFGHIVNISSTNGKIGSSRRTSYCASKFGIIGMMDSLRVEVRSTFLEVSVHTHFWLYSKLANTGVKVTNVCPGPVKTDVSKNALTKDGSLYGKTDKHIENGMPVERYIWLWLHSSGCHGIGRDNLAGVLNWPSLVSLTSLKRLVFLYTPEWLHSMGNYIYNFRYGSLGNHILLIPIWPHTLGLI